MNKIKNIWFNIRHFKFNSIFLRTFLFITALTVIPFIVLSIMFYSNTLKNIREEITLENSYIFDNSVNIIDRTLMEVDTLSSSLASNESTQLYTINNVSTDSFKTISRLAKTLPIIYRYIDSIYIYSEQTDTVIMDNNSIPLSDLSDTDWINAYRAVTSPKGTIIPRSKNNVYPQLITIIKPIYVADEKKGAIIMNINAQSITSISPCPIAKLSFTHKRYIPKTAISALIQMLIPTFFLKNSPKTGTIIMYKAVKKPVFPTVVYIMPIC